jgi:hypothetical protein
MWILKNSKDLLQYIQSRSLSSCNSIKTFDFSTLYPTILDSKLKDRLKGLIQLCFKKMNGQRRYKYLVLEKDKSYFVKKKKNTLILPKSSLKLISSTCSRFWLTTYLLCFSTDSRHTYGCKLRSSSRRRVPLFVWDRLRTFYGRHHDLFLVGVVLLDL